MDPMDNCLMDDVVWNTRDASKRARHRETVTVPTIAPNRLGKVHGNMADPWLANGVMPTAIYSKLAMGRGKANWLLIKLLHNIWNML